MSNDNWNIEFINEKLKYYLTHPDYEQYDSLIKEVLRDDIDPGAKWNLYALLMNHGTAQIAEQNLAEALRNVYISDENINEYVNHAVRFNPMMGYVSVAARSRQDMKHDYSLDIQIKVPPDNDNQKYFENAENLMARCREVLTMMLVESKAVSHEKIDPEKSET